MPNNVELISASYDNGLLTYNQSGIDFNNDGNPDAYGTGFFAPGPAVGAKVFHLKVPSFTEGALNIYLTPHNNLLQAASNPSAGPAYRLQNVESGVELRPAYGQVVTGESPIVQVGDELLITVSPDNKTLTIVTPSITVSSEYPSTVSPAYLLVLFAANYASLIPNLEVHCTAEPQT